MRNNKLTTFAGIGVTIALGVIGWGFWNGNFESILIGWILFVISTTICSEVGKKLISLVGAIFLSFFIILLYWYFWDFNGEQFQWVIAYCIIGVIIIVCTSIPQKRKTNKETR